MLFLADARDHIRHGHRHAHHTLSIMERFLKRWRRLLMTLWATVEFLSKVPVLTLGMIERETIESRPAFIYLIASSTIMMTASFVCLVLLARTSVGSPELRQHFEPWLYDMLWVLFAFSCLFNGAGAIVVFATQLSVNVFYS